MDSQNEDTGTPNCSGSVHSSTTPQHKLGTVGDDIASLIPLQMEWYFVSRLGNGLQAGRRGHEALMVPNDFVDLKLSSVMCEAKLSIQLCYSDSLKMWN